jgi:5-bromo-4-chloroindolyl phosphate hydrolysis protein
MLLIAHILVALSGLAAAGLAFLKPSDTKINTSYALLASTILSGVLLIVIAHASILHTCVSGLTFTALMYAGIAAASRKLAAETVRTDS